jgi:hypothetical protein
LPAEIEGEHIAATRAPVLLQEHGLALWLMTGTIVQNAVYALFQTFWHSPQAVDGLLPVYVLRPSRQIPIASRNNELHHVPVLELIGWVVRDVEKFGLRTVRAPVPLLAPTAVKPLLPESAPMPAAPANSNEVPADNNNDEDPFHDMLRVGVASNAPPRADPAHDRGQSRPPF